MRVKDFGFYFNIKPGSLTKNYFVYMAITKDKKQQQLLEITNLMRDAKSVVFAQYAWLSVKDISSLRKSLRGEWATIRVIKKTLIKLAAKDLYSVDVDDKNLEWQIAVICSNDELTAWPKIIKKAWKVLKQLKLTWGIFEGKTLSFSEVTNLADMPSKEELIAKMLWSFMSPIQWFYSANKAVLSWFARVLDGHRENLEKAA